MDSDHNLHDATLEEWAISFTNYCRSIARERIGDCEVSTVFLGMDHSFGFGPGLYFETMIFGGKHDGYCKRYENYDEATAGHDNIVYLLKEGRELP